MLALALSTAQGLVWWGTTPPWTAPDEPGHYLYARLMADLGRLPLRADQTAAVEAPVIASLAASGWWEYHQRPTPLPLPSRLASDPTLAASGVQIQEEPPLFYILPAWWLRRLPADPAQALRWLRLWPLFLRLLAVVAALALARVLRPNQPAWGLALAALVGAWPMVGFIGGSFNNTALALTWGAVAFLLLSLSLNERPRGRSWLLLLAAGVTTTAPFLVDSSLLYLWPLGLLGAGAVILRRKPRLWPRTLLVLLLPALLLLPHPGWASGWERTPPLVVNRGGAPSLLLADWQQDRQTISSQMLSGKSFLPLRGRLVTLTVDFWGEAGGRLGARLDSGQQAAAVECPIESQPQTCQVQLVISDTANQVRVRLSIGGLDDLAATGIAHTRPRLLDPEGRNLLFNGDARLPAALGSPLFSRLERNLPVLRGYFAQALAPTAWDAASQFRYLLFTGFTWASFWGYFGWLSRPLPWPVYALLAGLTLLAGWGLLQIGLQMLRRRQFTSADRVIHLAGLASLLILAQVWLPMVGQNWQPQGRYLFAALLPIALLHLAGWEQALPMRWRPYLPAFLITALFALNRIAWAGVRP